MSAHRIAVNPELGCDHPYRESLAQQPQHFGLLGREVWLGLYAAHGLRRLGMGTPPLLGVLLKPGLRPGPTFELSGHSGGIETRTHTYQVMKLDQEFGSLGGSRSPPSVRWNRASCPFIGAELVEDLINEHLGDGTVDPKFGCDLLAVKPGDHVSEDSSLLLVEAFVHGSRSLSFPPFSPCPAALETFLGGLNLAEQPQRLPTFILVDRQHVDHVGPVVASLVAIAEQV